MNNNSLVKTIGGVLLIVAILIYNRYHANAPLPIPNAPDTSTEAPSKEVTRNSSPPSINVERPEPKTPPPEPSARRSDPVDTAHAPKRDLDQDERKHGHTLQRHIGRTDEQLLQRLRDEPNISSASTYTDKDTAERCVGIAVEKNKSKIDAWLRQSSSHDNLEINYIGDGKTAIGRSIHHGTTRSVPCYNSKVILKPDGNSFYVLTSYPEGR